MLDVGQVLKVPITTGTLEIVSEEIIRMASQGRWGYVCVANVHMVVTAKYNFSLFSVMNKAVLVTSDGMPLVVLLKKQGFRCAERVAGPDLMIHVCKLSESAGLPVYFYGGSINAMKILNEKICQLFPSLRLAGVESPPTLANQPSVDLSVVDRINSSGAKIVFVGLGCPKQEFWMHLYTKELDAILIGVGAAFDFFSGEKKRAPAWMQAIGLEWLYRLYCEPRRLWKRYLVTNIQFAWLLLKEKVIGK